MHCEAKRPTLINKAPRDFQKGLQCLDQRPQSQIGVSRIQTLDLGDFVKYVQLSRGPPQT